MLGPPTLAAGCGSSHAPCPTPTDLLDRHREESEQIQEEAAAAEAAQEELFGQREEALRRIDAARAAEDSLARAKRRGRTRP